MCSRNAWPRVTVYITLSFFVDVILAVLPTSRPRDPSELSTDQWPSYAPAVVKLGGESTVND